MVERISEGGFRGRVYRVTHPDYADIDRTIEVGREHPGRFSPSGTGALYVSLEVETAIAELKRRAARLGRPLTSFAPRAVLTLEVVLHQLLDLADDSVREAWDITSSDLQTESEYTKCHAVARVARRAGYERSVFHQQPEAESTSLSSTTVGTRARMWN